MIELTDKGDVLLHLPDKTRDIGKIQNDAFYTRRSYYTHYMKKDMSYAFNKELLENDSIEFVDIILTDEFGKYLITRQRAIAIGKVKSEGGFEPQIFVPLDEMTKIR